MELPQGAMFCGECGRAVGARTVELRHPDSGMPLEPASPSAQQSSQQDTLIIEPIDLQSLDPERPDLRPLEWSESPEPQPALVEPDSAELEQDLPPDLEFPDDAEIPDSAEILPIDAAPVQDAEPFPWGSRGSSIFSDSDELERTILTPRREQGERFVLQFSTGESVTVHGTGLLGRNPTPQPGEYFDHLVVISDYGKSVSKTHLEFGQESGAFWVSDRFSGNGSIVREPESTPRRLTAGKRYRVVRGSRVDIGEQFFIIS
jgi:hypothetical protein